MLLWGKIAFSCSLKHLVFLTWASFSNWTTGQLNQLLLERPSMSYWQTQWLVQLNPSLQQGSPVGSLTHTHPFHPHSGLLAQIATRIQNTELCRMAKCLEMLMVWVLCWFPELPHSAAHLYLFSELRFITLFTGPPWVVPACNTFLPDRVDVGDFAILVHHSINLYIGFSTMLSWRFLKSIHRVSSCSQDSSHFLSYLIILW